ncbi:MAG: hypothetical protein PVF87_01120, partial [Acidimicrobiia bacterium]
MKRVLTLLSIVAAAAACTGEPGGGGVNISAETTTPAMVPTTTSTTVAPTTTTTATPVLVTGKVAAPDGAAVARAFVTMGAERVTTGSDGWFSFEIRTPTTMSVSKPGWSSVELEWDEATTYYEPVIAPRKVRG